MFLTAKQLAEWCEIKQKKKQAEWLDEQGIPYTLSHYNRPKVPISVVESLGLSLDGLPKKKTQPDYNGLKEKLNKNKEAHAPTS